MKFRYICAAPVVAISLLATPMVQAAAINSPVHAMFGKTKNVKLTLLNESGSPMEVKAGEEVIKLEQGKPVTVSLPEGSRVVANTSTEKTQAGTLIAEVSSAFNNATIHIK